MMETGNARRRRRWDRSFSDSPEVQRAAWRRASRRGTDRAVPVVEKPDARKADLFVLEQRGEDAFEH